jgi:hypothetical protein
VWRARLEARKGGGAFWWGGAGWRGGGGLFRRALALSKRPLPRPNHHRPTSRLGLLATFIPLVSPAQNVKSQGDPVLFLPLESGGAAASTSPARAPRPSCRPPQTSQARHLSLFPGLSTHSAARDWRSSRNNTRPHLIRSPSRTEAAFAHTTHKKKESRISARAPSRNLSPPTRKDHVLCRLPA